MPDTLALESPIVNAYKKQLALIKSNEKRSKLENLLRTSAYKNIQGAASSTGKYHPKFSNTEFGLSKHTKAVVRFIQVICEVFDEVDPDTMVIAAIAHDMFKYATEDSEHTSKHHAKDAGMALYEVGLKDEGRLVYSHMGKFDKDAAAPEKLDEKLLHLADYMASKKFININFDSDNNLLEESIKSFAHIIKESIEDDINETEQLYREKKIPKEKAISILRKCWGKLGYSVSDENASIYLDCLLIKTK